MSITRHHNEWLTLVPNSGPFLSLPVLAQAFSAGLEKPTMTGAFAASCVLAFDEWDDNELGHRPDPAIQRARIKLVLEETLGYEELLAEGQAIPQTLKSEIAEYGETLRPDWIVNDPATKKARLLVQVYPRSQSLTKPVQSSRWKASPDTRMMQLLHDTGIRLGLVTNGDHWMLVNAPKNETTGYVSWYANLWLEEPLTLRAFRTLLCADRFFSVPENETLGSPARPKRRQSAGSHRSAWLSGPQGRRGLDPVARQGRPGPRAASCWPTWRKRFSTRRPSRS